MQRICALPECGQLIPKGITGTGKCCCRSHMARYAAKHSVKRLGLPNKTKEDYVVYYRIKAIDKQKRIKQATPLWSDKSKIRKIYEQAYEMTKATGVKYEVDHIDPLTNSLVCGLHVPENLQIITLEENRKKRNSFKSYEIYFK
jgi:hypothetical protein